MGRTILAMGGGGFTMEPGNPALDDFILTLTATREPRILFLPTASGDANAQICAFRCTYGERSCRPIHLSLFRLEQQRRTLRELILSQDVIYVGGGSMRNLLAIWREHGIDLLLREAWGRGTVLAGLSAGAMCWFEAGITRSAGQPAPAAGLGFLPGSMTVHRDGDPTRLPVFLDAVSRGVLADGYAVDDGAGLLFHDDRLVRVVSSRPGARAYRVERAGDQAIQTPIEPDLLAAAAYGLQRDVPADVREFRAERYGAAGRR